jgi:hypothetical protein
MRKHYYKKLINIKSIIPFFLFIVSPLLMQAQDLSGLYMGTLQSEQKKKQNFEMIISEYRGKVTGYSYTTFIANDTFYYSVKRIKGERKDGMLVLQDVEMIRNNFPERVSKGVKQTTMFPLINDSTIDINNGKWETNQTKRFYSVKGNAAVEKQQDDYASSMVPHLAELKIETEYTVNKPRYQNTNADIVKTEPAKKPVSVSAEPKPNIKKTAPSVAITSTAEAKKQEPAIIKEPRPENAVAKSEPVKPAIKKEEVIVVTAPPVVKQEVVLAPEPKKKDIVFPAAPVIIVKNDPPVVTAAEPEKKPVIAAPKVSEPVAKAAELPAAVISRKNKTVNELSFKSDSLTIALYDNGIVDGDTVSLFLNGVNILSKQKLKESATKKTIYTTALPDSIELVLFAENLGSIPPNTGLMVIRDGETEYQIRFSADLSQNATIRLRRKKE